MALQQKDRGESTLVGLSVLRSGGKCCHEQGVGDDLAGQREIGMELCSCSMCVKPVLSYSLVLQKAGG